MISWDHHPKTKDLMGEWGFIMGYIKGYNGLS
jgi:hypothetical protein